LTVRNRGETVEPPAKLLSPVKMALIQWVPVLSAESENRATAWPLTTDNGTGGCAAPSTKNVTLPVGVLVPLGGTTVAVKVTAWPNVVGPGDALSVRVVVARLSTAWPTELVPRSVNQRLPSGPVVMPQGVLARGNSVMATPASSKRSSSRSTSGRQPRRAFHPFRRAE
jgi:hypothetical protein